MQTKLVGHGLSCQTPEIVFTKQLSTEQENGQFLYFLVLALDNYLVLNDANALQASDNNRWSSNQLQQLLQ